MHRLTDRETEALHREVLSLGGDGPVAKKPPVSSSLHAIQGL